MTAVPALRVVQSGTTGSDLGARPSVDVLDNVASFVARFNVFPSAHCVPTLALWYAHTHIADRFYVTPRLILDSAEPGSGKTRVLEVAQFLVAAPEMTISAKPAALFRLVQAGPITILFDEVDTIFNPKASGNGDNDDLRAMLNAGYKRSATIPRCVGDVKAMQVKRFKVYAPAVLAGIAGGMPATITTRAVTIHMRRRRPDECVDQFREKVVEREAEPIREALRAWVISVADEVGDAEPEMPQGVTDRAAEIWEPLIALADAAGGHWPDTARNACRHFVVEDGAQAGSLGVRLLADLRELYSAHDTDRLSTADILDALIGLDESPWPDLYGKPLDARRLARELGRYGVKPVTFETDSGSAKGYVTFGTTGKQAQAGLTDAWSRYLPATASNAGKSSKSGKRAGQPLIPAGSLTDHAVRQQPSGKPMTTQLTRLTALTAEYEGAQ